MVYNIVWKRAAALCLPLLLFGCADDTGASADTEGTTAGTGPQVTSGPTTATPTTAVPTTTAGSSDTTDPPTTTSSTESCCSVHPTSGCDIASVEACVCETSAFCCQFEWDSACVDLAENRCGGCDVADDTADTGGSDGGTCCDVLGTPGCSNMEVQDCVCAADAFCCRTEWDGMCVDQAQAMCGAVCEIPPGTGDCCQANGTPGCDDMAINDCTCALDPFCCDQEWDLMCVAISAAECDSGCEVDAGDCCLPNGTPGCSDTKLQDCVCELDAFCCDSQWDEKCVGVAQVSCGGDCGLATGTDSGTDSGSSGDASSSGGGSSTGGSSSGGSSSGGNTSSGSSGSTGGSSSGGNTSSGSSGGSTSAG